MTGLTRSGTGGFITAVPI